MAKLEEYNEQVFWWISPLRFFVEKNNQFVCINWFIEQLRPFFFALLLFLFACKLNEKGLGTLCNLMLNPILWMRDILYINVEKHLETYFEYPAVEREKDI